MAYDNDNILALSISNESLAIAIRRGAPLASYSSDRKCLDSYMKHLTHPDAAILICFSCARNFPCLHASKENPIRRYRVDRNMNGTTKSTPSCFFGMSMDIAFYIFGLVKLCARYGAASDNVMLKEDDEAFDDWHLLMEFEKDFFF